MRTNKRMIGLVIVLAVGVCWAWSTAASADLSDGLVGYWPMDEGSGTIAVDLSGSGNNGKLNGTPTWIPSAISGLPGYALKFDGGSHQNGDAVQINPTWDGGDGPDVLRPTNAVSVAAWAKADSFAYYAPVFYNAFWTGSTQSGCMLYTYNNAWNWWVKTENANYARVYRSGTADQWTHLVGTYDKTLGEVKLYVNGQAVAPATGITQVIDWNPIPWNTLIGRYNDDNEDRSFLGSIDDLAIWNRALTPAEVTYLYNNGDGNPAYVPIVNVDPTSIQVSEEGPTSDSYQIVLAYEPNADGPGTGGADTVLILCEPNGAGSGKDTDINIGNGPGDKIILTFTSDNWDTPQTITVTAVNDSDMEGDHAVEIRHRVLSAADPNYAGAYVPTVTVNITDNDIPEITLIETRDYTYVSESGATDSYTLSLNIQPTAELTIEILQDSNELRLNGAGAGASITLTFTTTNWDTAQTVTVAAAQDDIYEGDHTALITHTVGGASQYATWPDAGGVTIADVYVYIGDDDPETLTDGLVAYYPLDGDPNDYSGNGNHGTLVAAHPDWVTGVLGGALDMDAQEYISIGVADIAPPWTASMWVKRQGNPNPGAILIRSSAFALKLEQWYNTKNVGFTRFNVADYNFGYSAPLESWVHLVFVGTKSGTTLWVDGEARGYVGASISCPMNTISAASESLYAVLDEVAIWERALSGAQIRKLHDGTETDPDPILHLRLDNDLVDSSGRSNHGIMASVDADDPNWVAGKILGALQLYGDDYVTMDGVAHDITDNDTTWNLWVNITQSKTWHTLLAVNTAGGGNVVMLELANGEPDIYEADGEQAYTGVNIIDGQWHMLTYVRSGATGTIYIDGAPKATHSAVSYNFSANDRWSLAQEWDGGPTPSDFAIGTIDDVLVWDRALSLSEVQELYNDGAGRDYPNPAGLQIVQTDGATEVNEEGATSDTYTIALNNQPGGTVVVTVDSADPNITVLGTPVSLTFTSANWNTPQTITVRAVDDLIFFELDHAAVITHTAAGDPNYDGFIDTLTVIVIDNDIPAVTVVPTTLSIFEGESDTYTVALSDEPVKETGDVLVTVDPNDGGYGLELDLGAGAGEPITLTFTKTNWDTAQTVTVMVLENAVLTSDRSATITHMVSSDGAYDGIAVDSVSVSIKEDECGHWGYSPMDFNQDCRVDLLDLHEFLSEWLICTDPAGSGCIKAFRSPDNPAGVVNGLDYEYYEGDWTALPDFDALTPVHTGSINNFDISGWTSDTFAFRFTGYIEVPDDNIYTFYTTSDDGSKLLIADTLVVDNDGVHGMTERFGTIGLFAGKHALTVIMFDGGGNQALQVRYESLGYGGISKRIIPDSVLYH